MLKLMRTPRKYVQGANALEEFYTLTQEMGTSFLLICSKSGEAACREKIEKSCQGKAVRLHFEVFGGVSSVGEIERMRQIVREENPEVVVGVGGGSAIDTAKPTAYYEGKKLVICPTVCATDAPCTGLSVLYENDHRFKQYIFYPDNPDAVIVDSTIIAQAPVRFFIAGMGDALGTYFEARSCAQVQAPSLENGGITQSALSLCQLCYQTLLHHGERAKKAVERGLLTPDVEATIEANIYLSGVGADNGGLAAAHSIYNGLTGVAGFTALHGEAVAFGTLVQLLLEADSRNELATVMDFCAAVGLPLTLQAMGLTKKEQVRQAAEKACLPGESIHNMPQKPTAEQLYQAMLAMDAFGQAYVRN